MPALPELHWRASEIRPVEIFGHDYAHHASEANRHVAIAAEVEKDAEGECDQKNPPPAQGLSGEMRFGEVNPAGQIVSRPFLGKPHCDADQADHCVTGGE